MNFLGTMCYCSVRGKFKQKEVLRRMSSTMIILRNVSSFYVGEKKKIQHYLTTTQNHQKVNISKSDTGTATKLIASFKGKSCRKATLSMYQLSSKLSCEHSSLSTHFSLFLPILWHFVLLPLSVLIFSLLFFQPTETALGKRSILSWYEFESKWSLFNSLFSL